MLMLSMLLFNLPFHSLVFFFFNFLQGRRESVAIQIARKLSLKEKQQIAKPTSSSDQGAIGTRLTQSATHWKKFLVFLPPVELVSRSKLCRFCIMYRCRSSSLATVRECRMRGHSNTSCSRWEGRHHCTATD